MSRTARMAGAGALALLGITSCWSAPTAIETRSLDGPQPEAPPTKPTEDPNKLPTTEFAPIAIPPRSVEGYVPAATQRRLLPGGVVGLARDVDAGNGSSALLRLALPVGTTSGEEGVAELTAWTVAQTANAAKNLPSLRQALANLGGNLDIRIGSRSTTFDVTVRSDQWRTALDALIAAVNTPTLSETQIEFVRREVLARRRQELRRHTLENLLHVVMRSSGTAPERYLNAIEDANPDVVTRFHQLSYRPAGAVISLWVPGTTADQTLDAVAKSALVWTGPDAPTLVSKGPPTADVRGGIYWSPTESELCDFALVLPLPHLASEGAVELHTLLECLTMDGVGGRLGSSMRSTGAPEIVLRNRSYWDGATRHMLLWTTAAQSEVMSTWAALQLAINSFPRRLPTTEEIRAAAQRLRLRILAEYSNPRLWLESVTSQGLRGQEPADIADVLRKLDDPLSLDLVSAIRSFVPRPTALAVVGNAPPEDAANAVVTVTPTLVTAITGEVPPSEAQQRAAARPYLNKALAAMGSANEFRERSGYSFQLTRTSADGVSVDETIWFADPNRFRRIRHVLATTIETVVNANQHVEQSGDEKTWLPEPERMKVFEEAARHPLILLSRFMRGEIGFRLVSLRESQGREMAVVQLTSTDRERLRMTIDVESGLVRSVETLQWRADLGSRVQIVERYSDYRRAERMRLPFHCVVTADGAEAMTITWSQILPSLPEDIYFEKGGPPRIFTLEQLQLYNQKRALDQTRWEAKQRAAQKKVLQQETERQEALEREAMRLKRAAANQGKGKKRQPPK